MALRISALVPSLNEEEAIETALKGLRDAGVDQIVVADGGSRDRTVERARPLADSVLVVPGGLFAQLNAAAREATGDVLLFHYADVGFPPTGRDAISNAIGSGGAVGGAFTLAFGSPRRRYAIIAGGTKWRNRLGIGPFGDQSIFVRADVFLRIGELDTKAFFGDYDLVRRLRRVGRFVMLPDRVEASTRRWEKNGFVSTLLSHWWLTCVCLVTGGKGTRSAAERVRHLREAR